MSELTDHELLSDFARTESGEAFGTLVTRYVNLVYSAALRFTGNAHHAEEITQAVFIILTRKAGTLSPRVALSGWLYQTTRLTAANFMKAELRRQRREQEAYMQSTLNDAGSETWRQIAPLLEDAMGCLGETDRNAVVLRYFENKTAAEAASVLKLSEAATHKRTNRALDKLRKIFGTHGVSSTTSIIAGAISAHSIHPAPTAVAASVKIAAAAKGAAASASLATLIHGGLKLMAWSNAKTTVAIGVGVLLTAGTTFLLVNGISHKPDLAELQGTWTGQELVGDIPMGTSQMTLQGNTLDFQGADPRESYKATFTLNEHTNPKQATVIITDCSDPDYVGKTAYGIYSFEHGEFKISASEPGSTSAPRKFNSPNTRTFVFKKSSSNVRSIAANASSEAPAAPSSINGQSIPGWGNVIDPDGDCTVAFADGKLVVNLPGTDHALMPERGRANAPRVMQEVTGPFDVQVKVTQRFKGGAKTIVAGRSPYQDAGLLVWLDDKNNLKLAPAQIGRNGESFRYFHLEFRYEGKYGELNLPRESVNLLKAPTYYLRLQIHKDKTTASVSGDGVKWFSTSLPGDDLKEKMQVGIIAENNTTSPLTIGFEEFALKQQ